MVRIGLRINLWHYVQFCGFHLYTFVVQQQQYVYFTYKTKMKKTTITLPPPTHQAPSWGLLSRASCV